VALPEGRAGGEIEVVCKAVDEAYNSQPDRMDAIYNFRGIVVNGWQRLRVRVGES
jgi:sulfite oxidase